MGELYTNLDDEEIGNFFIMDTEQLVNNPYEQLQKDAASDYQKKTSLTEKCTSVKNNVCENHFLMMRGHLDREMNKHLRQIHEDTSRLRYEVKLLDLNKRKHDMEFKKRLEPKRDFSYDENQLTKTEKRLGVNIESYYLDKKLRYPVRGKMTGNLIVTPIVAKARHSLKEQRNIKKLEKERERVLTAKSVTSSDCFPSSVGRENRQRVRLASRSAPLTMRSFSISHERKPSQSRFPNIQSSLDGSAKIRGGRHSPPNRVKFAFENPMKILTQSDNQSGNFVRSHPFQGVRRHSSHTMDSSDDDSDSGISERIDLRAILFGKPEDNRPDRDNLSVKSHPTSLCNANSHPPTPMIRRAGSNVPQQQTQEKLRKEAKQIQDKVVTFLNRLETDPLIKRKVDEEFSDDDLVEDPHSTIGYIIPKSKVKPEVVPTPSPKPVEKEEEEEEPEERPIKIKPKEAWKLIRGHTENGSLRGAYTPADLVMQQLTGILLVGGKKGHIPLNSASRAMRHTATFKMRKVVEQLIEGRTRFQQHEVDELKKKMEGDETTKLAGEGTEAATVETVA